MDESGDTIIIDDRCDHGKEIRTTVWCRPTGDRWQILGQPKCRECPNRIPVAIVNQSLTYPMKLARFACSHHLIRAAESHIR